MSSGLRGRAFSKGAGKGTRTRDPLVQFRGRAQGREEEGPGGHSETVPPAPRVCLRAS